MFNNYSKATFRHISKSKVNFIFKLGGLTMALLSFLIITLYVVFQLSFDQFHEQSSSIYRVNSIRDEDGKLERYATVPPAIGPALKSQFQDVMSSARIGFGNRVLVRHNETLTRIYIVEADNSLFDVLTFKFISGDKRAIDRPGTVVLTSSTAKQIFGTEDPIGKMISLPENNNKVLEVTAIIEDSPSNTHLPFSAIMPFGAFENTNVIDNDWRISWDGSVFLYLRLDPSAHPDSFSEKIQGFIDTRIARQEDGSEKNFRVFLQPIEDIYLSPGLKMEFIRKGNGFYVYVFSLMGFFLLVIACINYINLSIADFHNRSKEMGIRKILGARKRQIALQIIVESVFYCLAALMLSLLIVGLVFPRISAFLDPNIHLSMLLNPTVIGTVVATILFIVVFSTAYSARKLSMNSPVRDLKKGILFGKNLSTGKVLLLVQFMISIICTSVTLIVSEQVDFIQTKDLGFDRTNVITLFMPDEYPQEKVEVLKNEIKTLAGVDGVSYTHYLVTGVPYLKDWYKIEMEGKMKQIQVNEIFVDYDFFSTMGIEILRGRSFDVNNPADSHTAFIVNETAAREFGWTDPIGKQISYGYGETTGEKWEGTVVGMAEDFNTRSLHEKIEPLVIRLPYDSWPGSSLNVKVKGDLRNTLVSIKSTYEKVLPGYLMDYGLVEDLYSRHYHEETKALKALQLGTWIVLLISSFGIFSLSLFMSMKRMKEFGIRKVLGATVKQIAFLHIGYFFRIAIVAVGTALPISYWVTEQWLKGFAYRIEPGFIVFMTVILILLLLVIVSAAYSSIKASRMNPVEAIKLE